MIVVRLGTFDLTRYDTDGDGQTLSYVPDEAVVYARIAQSFPVWGGSNAKGFATVPPLERENRAVKNNGGWHAPTEDAIQEITGQEAEIYSWGWEEVPINKAKHMKYAYDLADAMLRYG